jgi:hypothetical protein
MPKVIFIVTFIIVVIISLFGVRDVNALIYIKSAEVITQQVLEDPATPESSIRLQSAMRDIRSERHPFNTNLTAFCKRSRLSS